MREHQSGKRQEEGAYASAGQGQVGPYTRADATVVPVALVKQRFALGHRLQGMDLRTARSAVFATWATAPAV